MALATTSAIWRSTGGDTTRTAVAGSMDMIAPFYIANTSASSNVVVSSATNAPALILPAGAVVLTVNITNPSTGANSTCNIGFTPIVGNTGPGQSPTLGTNVPNAFVNNANVTTRQTINIGTASTGGASLGNVANATNLIVVTSAIGTAGAVGGPVTGSIRYYVADPTYGEEIV